MQGYEYKSNYKSQLECFLIIYDICDDRRRRKNSKLFESYGKRVQESAFEFCVIRSSRRKIIDTIPKLISDEDSVRIYPMRYEDDILSWGCEINYLRSDVLIA